MNKPRLLNAIDLFCGAGGMSTGAILSGRFHIGLAVNHCQTAIFSHQNNHPDTRHICARVQDMNIRSDETIPNDYDALFAGIECVFHSNARGAAPIDDQRRATAWRVLDWIEAKQFDICVFENVREFVDWGPIDKKTRRKIKAKKGEIFDVWIAAIRALGYEVETRILNAADYGAATKRLRLFIQCRRDGKPIAWPEPKLRQREKNEAYRPGVHWKPAFEIIDWSKPTQSIFDRKKMLVDKTLRRIRIGLEKFVRDAKQPFIVAYHGGTDPKRDGTKRQHSIGEPLPTVDTQPRFGVCQPHIVNMKGTSTAADISEPSPTITSGGGHVALSQPYLVPQFGERENQSPRSHGVSEPTPAVTGHGAGAVVQPFLLQNGGSGLGDPKYDATFDASNPAPTILGRNYHGIIQPYVVEVNHGESGGSRSQSVDEPIGVVATRRGRAVVSPFLLDIHGQNWTENSQRDTQRPMPTILAKPGNSIAVPFLVKFYGTATVAHIDCPCPTVTSKDRFALAMAHCDFGNRDLIGPVLPFMEVENPTMEMNRLLDTMTRLGVYDIGFRMLKCDELLRAQGFPDDYELHGNIAEQMKQIGNAVPPPMFQAICEVL